MMRAALLAGARTTMLNKGWIPEGSGNLGVIMCSPA